MYEELFQSAARPFRATPDARYYFPHDAIEAARQTVLRAVTRAEGPVVVMGGAGLGKSLLGELLANDFRGRFDVIKLQAARVDSCEALLQNILFELRLPYRDLTEGELRLSIIDRLEPSDLRAPGGLLILVDEAHNLTPELLDELRQISNITRDGQPRAQVVLIGSMALEDTFASPRMESFNQRLAARCYLTPMSREQTRQYVEHQISAAGYRPTEFITAEGLNSVYAASEGVPRLANQIMDHALVLAITNRQCPVSAALIEEAWADLQQLPAPWQSAADRQREGAAVEFGELRDEEADIDEAALQSYSDNSLLIITGDENDWLDTVVFHEEPVDQINGESSEPQAGFTAEELNTADVTVEFGQLEDDDAFAVATEVEQPAPSTTHGFFAAFSEPEPNELPELSEAEDVPSAEVEEATLTRPRVVFDASQAFQAAKPQDAPQNTLPADSYFADRPTDDRLLALEDEVIQYDSMGVWENDPPMNHLTDPHAVGNFEVVTLDVFAPSPDTNAPQDSRDAAPVAQADSQANDAPVTFHESEDDATNENATNDIGPGVSNSKAAQATSAIHNLFGDDFDEEFSINNDPLAVVSRATPPVQEPLQPVDNSLTSDLNGYHFEEQPQLAITPELSTAAASTPETASSRPQEREQTQLTESEQLDARIKAALVADHLQRIQEFADHVNGQAEANVEEVLRELTAEDILADDFIPDYNATTLDEALNGQVVLTSGSWSTDVAAIDVQQEKRIQAEVEDIVSHLNFSAFEVEPYSIEQISLDANAPKSAPEDSIRGGDQDQIYMMHRPGTGGEATMDEPLHSEATANFDDDRDLLIVEEEITASQAIAEETEQKTTKTTPYRQLFSRLRK